MEALGSDDTADGVVSGADGSGIADAGIGGFVDARGGVADRSEVAEAGIGGFAGGGGGGAVVMGGGREGGVGSDADVTEPEALGDVAGGGSEGGVGWDVDAAEPEALGDVAGGCDLAPFLPAGLML